MNKVTLSFILMGTVAFVPATYGMQGNGTIRKLPPVVLEQISSFNFDSARSNRALLLSSIPIALMMRKNHDLKEKQAELKERRNYWAFHS